MGSGEEPTYWVKGRAAELVMGAYNAGLVADVEISGSGIRALDNQGNPVNLAAVPGLEGQLSSKGFL